jgi:hypothetical protein
MRTQKTCIGLLTGLAVSLLAAGCGEQAPTALEELPAALKPNFSVAAISSSL